SIASPLIDVRRPTCRLFPYTTLFRSLFHNGTQVDRETVAVNGNGGPYTTPTGFTLPSSAAATGTYQWNASYSGDSNNNTVSDVNIGNAHVSTRAANPTLMTTPTSNTV